VVKIDADIPLDRAALVSCGVMTGVGAVVNTARVEARLDDGGVRLRRRRPQCHPGLRIAGAAMIVAVDTADAKLEMARQFGATHVLNAKAEENVVKALKKLTGGGADYAFECVGYGEIAAQAYGCLRKGGTAVVVGVASRRTPPPCARPA
jgi:Zn-dependent alcohol dehydrogenase